MFLYGTRLLHGHCNERGQVVWCAGSTAKGVRRVETLAGADELPKGEQGWVRIPEHLFVAILKYIDVR